MASTDVMRAVCHPARAPSRAKRQRDSRLRISVGRFASGGLAGRVDGEDKFPHRFPVDEMALDDLLQDLRGAGVIPDSVGIDHGNWAVRADAQAIDLAAINQRLRAHQLELLQARLEKFPRG